MIVGAGPTGLALAVELLDAGVDFRIIDSAPTPVHESRALAIQARTLEVLERAGVSPELVAAGNTATTLVLHARGRPVSLPLFDDGARGETRFPFLLFLPQSDTERTLLARLEARGVQVERNTSLTAIADDGERIRYVAETPAGSDHAEARYVVGCDGAHSSVRRLAGVGFVGAGFPQAFALADLEVDGLQKGRVHAFVAGSGIMFFFPLREPASWRMLGMLPDATAPDELGLQELQAIADTHTRGVPGAVLRLHDPVWRTTFRVQSRRAAHFRTGRILLAGDAAHIHSPAGAQGMNTGIQDAVNLGWKLAQVIRGLAGDHLLDTYEAERLPVARGVLRMTDRMFRIATTQNAVVRVIRPRLAPILLRAVARSAAARRIGFRAISELGLNYRASTLSVDARPRIRGVRAGARLPDLQLTIDGRPRNLRDCLVTPGYLLAFINADPRDHARLKLEGSRDVATVIFGESNPDTHLLASDGITQLLVRPDGYVAYTAGGNDATGLRRYLDRVTWPGLLSVTPRNTSG
ncbi:MAG: hypothetical protein QOF36_164 [Microbacteriaceae bacterium]|nr:hypothetical protein [Microbacteriaceae bacterium]